jgi:hypothetical protein
MTDQVRIDLDEVTAAARELALTPMPRHGPEQAVPFGAAIPGTVVATARRRSAEALVTTEANLRAFLLVATGLAADTERPAATLTSAHDTAADELTGAGR